LPKQKDIMQKTLDRYIKYPIIIICIVICISGLRWLISPEPWMLDQVANEERLAMTFNDLFLIEGNDTLDEYLKQIYRFLGLFVFAVGFSMLVFTSNEFFKIKRFRDKYLLVLGVLLASNIVLAYFWIPSSHFIYIMWGAISLYIISVFNHIKLE
tara:strand:+ start:92 stop:556 length:465 start_codon:yes stop_codon:yes gene_type:complete